MVKYLFCANKAADVSQIVRKTVALGQRQIFVNLLYQVFSILNNAQPITALFHSKSPDYYCSNVTSDT